MLLQGLSYATYGRFSRLASTFHTFISPLQLGRRMFSEIVRADVKSHPIPNHSVSIAHFSIFHLHSRPYAHCISATYINRRGIVYDVGRLESVASHVAGTCAPFPLTASNSLGATILIRAFSHCTRRLSNYEPITAARGPKRCLKTF